MTESFKDLLEETGFFKEELNQTGLRNLTVTNVSPKHIFVEVGMKAQGVIPAEEFKTGKKDNINIKEGDTIPVFIDAYDNGWGQPIVSYTKARIELNKEDINKSLQSRDFFLEVEGSHPTKVGIVAKYHNTEIFIPYTLLGFDSNSKEFYDEQFINNKFKVKVIKADFTKNHIVSSHKAYLEKEKGLSFDKLIESLEIGKIYEVPLNERKFKNYGIFTSINHIDTLLKVNDIGWKNISDPKDYFNSGEKTTKVVLTEIDTEKERISVSHKLANTQPWDSFNKNHSEGDIIEVKVVSIKDDYMLVRYNNEIDFMLHQNEISNQDIGGSLDVLYGIGDEIKAVIKQIDVNNFKINLSVKQLNEKTTNIKEGDITEGKLLSKSENGLKIGHQHLVFWIPRRNLTEKYNHQDILRSLKSGDNIEFKITSTQQGSLYGTLVLDSMLENYNFKKGDKVSGFKVSSLDKGKIMVINESGLKGFVNILGNVKVNPKDIFKEDEFLSDLIFKSIDKNNYFHFDYFINYENEYKNPKLGDLIK